MTPTPDQRPPFAHRLILGWLPAALWAGMIFWGSDQSDPPLGWLALLFPGSDKLIHAGLYLGFGLLLCRALLIETGEGGVHRRWWIAVAAVVGALYGLSDEFHQGFVPGRQVQSLDLLADSLGACLGALLWGVGLPAWRRRRAAAEGTAPDA